ncbi:leucine-rich repeat-containing protein 15-like [Aphidius gifuensis]|uniref:leucine-rich repeat-containing protein 15-like n=1 Tax=Aphidius gifuensis TaxID=684658 RepID=UPI001CDBE0F5|nr:leucine-rich repeat-containing protein 15-like [Aphidius gifuensis]
MEKLIELVMDYNRIYTLCGADDQCAGGILKDANNLEKLSLSNVQLTFVSMTKLEILDLSGNQLQSLSTNWISQENNLQRLNLNNNLFTNTSSMRLDNVAKLQVLDISGNPLEKITVKSFKYLPENTTVDVIQGYKCY